MQRSSLPPLSFEIAIARTRPAISTSSRSFNPPIGSAPTERSASLTSASRCASSRTPPRFTSSLIATSTALSSVNFLSPMRYGMIVAAERGICITASAMVSAVRSCNKRWILDENPLRGKITMQKTSGSRTTSATSSRAARSTRRSSQSNTSRLIDAEAEFSAPHAASSRFVTSGSMSKCTARIEYGLRVAQYCRARSVAMS